MSLWSKSADCLCSTGIPYHALFTGEAGDAMSLTTSACAEGYRRFIAVGGDGTVHDVLNGIMSYLHDDTTSGLDDFTLAVIPAGSGNDWIRTSGVPKDILEASLLLKNGRIAKQDVVRVTLLDSSALPDHRPLRVSYMANVGGVGLDASVCSMVNDAKKNGRSGKMLYVNALARNLIHRKKSVAKVLCGQEEVFSGAYISMSFGIGKYSGGGMRQTPEAILDDGLLDMTVIPDLPLSKLAVESPKLLNGKLLTVKEVVVSRGRSFVVLPDDGASVPVEVDGEVIGNAPVRFDILDRCLNILVP